METPGAGPSDVTRTQRPPTGEPQTNPSVPVEKNGRQPDPVELPAAVGPDDASSSTHTRGSSRSRRGRKSNLPGSLPLTNKPFEAPPRYTRWEMLHKTPPWGRHCCLNTSVGRVYARLTAKKYRKHCGTTDRSSYLRWHLLLNEKYSRSWHVSYRTKCMTPTGEFLTRLLILLTAVGRNQSQERGRRTQERFNQRLAGKGSEGTPGPVPRKICEVYSSCPRYWWRWCKAMGWPNARTRGTDIVIPWHARPWVPRIERDPPDKWAFYESALVQILQTEGQERQLWRWSCSATH